MTHCVLFYTFYISELTEFSQVNQKVETILHSILQMRRWRHLAKSTQVRRGKTGVRTQLGWLQKPDPRLLLA